MNLRENGGPQNHEPPREVERKSFFKETLPKPAHDYDRFIGYQC